MLLVGRQASAVTIIPATDWDPIVTEIDDPIRTSVDVFDGDLGALVDAVYVIDDGAFYYYAHTVVPLFFNAAEFNTQFPVGGFADIAGYSFGMACTAAGMPPPGVCTDPEDLFTISLDPDGTIDWNVNFPDESWDFLEGVTFFFGSRNPPAAELKTYKLKNSEIHTTADSLAPTPEPGSMLLLGSGLAALYGARRRRMQKG
jgi:hypothetical protein